MGHNWRWAHAVLSDGQGGWSVFEILSAQASLGPWKTPRVTTAHFWHRGKHHASTGLWTGLRNATFLSGRGWGFQVSFGGLRVEGECAPAEGMVAEVAYTDVGGRKLSCANSKTGSMRLTVSGPAEALGELSTEDGAAVETVRPSP